MRLLTVFGFLFLFFNSFAQNAIVSFDEHKVLWNGYENKISIGYPEKVTIEYDTSDVEQGWGSFEINAIGKNQFTIKPLLSFQQETPITFIMKDASGEIVFEEGYRVFSLPTPSIKIFGEYNNGHIGRKVDDVIIDEDYLNLDVKYSIRSFDLDIEYSWGLEDKTIHIEGENLLETLKNVCDTFNIADMANFKITVNIVNPFGIVMRISDKFWFVPKTSFHPNGKISVQRTLDKNTVPNGEQKYFYDNGQLEMVECSPMVGDFDKTCSLDFLTQYYRDGSIREKGEMLDDGTIKFTRYHENGKKKLQGTRAFEAGWFVGKLKYYNNKGKLTCTEVFDKNGGLISSKGDCK